MDGEHGLEPCLRCGATKVMHDIGTRDHDYVPMQWPVEVTCAKCGREARHWPFGIICPVCSGVIEALDRIAEERRMRGINPNN